MAHSWVSTRRLASAIVDSPCNSHSKEPRTEPTDITSRTGALARAALNDRLSIGWQGHFLTRGMGRFLKQEAHQLVSERHGFALPSSAACL